MLDDWIQVGLIYTHLVCPGIFEIAKLQNANTIIGSKDPARTIMPAMPVDFRVKLISSMCWTRYVCVAKDYFSHSSVNSFPDPSLPCNNIFGMIDHKFSKSVTPRRYRFCRSLIVFRWSSLNERRRSRS
jgi:hypothetical protein